MISGQAGGHPGKEKIFYLMRPAAGGMCSHLLQLLRRFGGDYTLYLGASPHLELEKSSGLPAASLFHLPLTGTLSPVNDLASFRRLCRLLRTHRPALLHIHGFKAALPGLAAARRVGIPVLITVHNHPAYLSSFHVPAALRALGAEKAHYIAVSEALAGDLAAWGVRRERISVIHNGIDPAPYKAAAAGRFSRPWSTDDIVVGTAARFAVQKGLTYFLQAAAVLAPLFLQMRFLVIGDGPGRFHLEKQALQLGLSGRLSFCGHCTDLPRRLADMDIFVLPSLTEGLPLAVLEAAAAGCAVVASGVGGIPGVITGGVHGLLVPPADVTALARAVAALVRDPALARRLARAGCERVVSCFTLERMLSRTAALYTRLLREYRCHTPESAESATAGVR